jgi:UDP-glucose:O-linked fucose beta-1,3-glucosyltransferase
MSGAPGSLTAVSFSTNPGEGYNLMRQVLVRMVLAVRQASLFRRSWSPEGKGELCLALAPICPTPHVSAGGHPPEGLAWSRLIDLEHLAGEIGMPVVDLEAFVAEHPAAPWRLLHLRTSPRILAMLPGSPPDAWERRDAEPDPIGCRCRPANWLRWSSVQAIDAFFSPGSTFLARETFSHPGHEVGGIFLSHAETMNWGRVFDSVAYWRVIAALRPAPLIRDLAAQLRPPGAYLGVHWRRGDFRQVHPDHSPSPAIAAEQIVAHARTHSLPTVFVATDAGDDEIAALRGPIEGAGLTLVTLEPDSVPDLNDLERAVLEQTILFDSAVFVGTRGSTFSRTVFETREAAGNRPPESTPVAAWNVLCGDAHHPGRTDDMVFGPVEPRRAFKPGPKRTEPGRSLDPVRFALSDPLYPGAEDPAAAGKRWTASGAPDVHLLKEFSGGKPGAWTILPTLPALAESLAPAIEWVFFAPADLAINPQEIATWLGQHDGHSGGFVGRALRDSRPTAIHHYRQDQLAYPDFRCGFALSRSLVLQLAEGWKSRKPTAGFHIDAAYELAVAVEACGFRLTDEPRLAGLIPVPPSPASPVDPDEVVFAIKTHGGNHHSRLPVLQRTWGRDVANLVFYSDVFDPAIPTIPVGVANLGPRAGLKFHVIARHLRGHHGDREWFVIADDDTLLSVPRLMELLCSYANRRDEPLFLGQRYGYGHHLPGGGYDYLTMGAGMVMNRRGLFALLEASDPPDIDEPDDMWVGRCLKKMGIEVVHHEGFHQEPPGAYPPAILTGLEAVSFHRHAPDNPDEVYAKYLAPETE